jgi:hypothetical protein
MYYCATKNQIFAIKEIDFNNNTLLNKVSGKFKVEYHYNLSDYIKKTEIKEIELYKKLIYLDKELAECRLINIDNLIGQYTNETYDNYHKYGKIIDNKPIGRWWFMFSNFKFSYIIDFDENKCISYKYDKDTQCIINIRHYQNYDLIKNERYSKCKILGRRGIYIDKYYYNYDDLSAYELNYYFYPIPTVKNYKIIDESSESGESSDSGESGESYQSY